MSSWGSMILSFFGGIFCLLTAPWLAKSRLIVIAAGVLITVLLVGVAYRHTRLIPAREYTDRARKAILWSTVGEGIGILVGINVAVNTGHPNWTLPAIALVVALHFLPIAAAVPFPRFYFVAAGLAVAAFAGAFLSTPTGPVLTGLGGAVCLWLAAVASLVENRRRRT